MQKNRRKELNISKTPAVCQEHCLGILAQMADVVILVLIVFTNEKTNALVVGVCLRQHQDINSRARQDLGLSLGPAGPWASSPSKVKPLSSPTFQQQQQQPAGEHLPGTSLVASRMPRHLGPNVNPLYSFRIDLLNPHSEEKAGVVPKYLQQVSKTLPHPQTRSSSMCLLFILFHT